MEIDETPGEVTALDEDFEKKARKVGNRDADDQPLNINSLMDIMTILLVFLLVSGLAFIWLGQAEAVVFRQTPQLASLSLVAALGVGSLAAWYLRHE